MIAKLHLCFTEGVHWTLPNAASGLSNLHKVAHQKGKIRQVIPRS